MDLSLRAEPVSSHGMRVAETSVAFGSLAMVGGSATLLPSGGDLLEPPRYDFAHLHCFNTVLEQVAVLPGPSAVENFVVYLT